MTDHFERVERVRDGADDDEEDDDDEEEAFLFLPGEEFSLSLGKSKTLSRS